MSAIIPIPRIPITVRPGTMEDLAFIDSLQKKHTKQVGFMPTKQFEGKIKAGHVLVAWASRPCALENSTGETPMPQEEEERVGYCIGNDQYFKRDDVGIIYQMNVVPGKQRGFVGATLLKAMFEQSAYGCRLYCCWCAQDIEANHFWESMQFVPLAFRAGSRGKGRVHIFWQKRIRAGDETTPYWFPSQTTSGSIREDRLVLPIPPGTHWRDAKPLILPQGDLGGKTSRQIEGAVASRGEPRAKGRVIQSGALGVGFLKFKGEKKPRAEKPPRQKRAKQKNDPRLVAAARELRDRWLEKVQDDPSLLLPSGKYDVSRALIESAQPMTIALPVPRLPAA